MRSLIISSAAAGVVRAAEIQMRNLGSPIIPGIYGSYFDLAFKAMDANGDGVVELKEFRDFHNKVPSS